MYSLIQMLCLSAVWLVMSFIPVSAPELPLIINPAPAIVPAVTVSGPPAPIVLRGWLTTAYSYKEKHHLLTWGCKNSLGYSLVRLVEGCHQVASDWSVLPLGSIVNIPDVGKCIVTDSGGAVIGKHIDIHYDSLADMNDRGSHIADITVLRWGWKGDAARVTLAEK
jgi:3D (Asp-Asp-Asp) domain-containing protein